MANKLVYDHIVLSFILTLTLGFVTVTLGDETQAQTLLKFKTHLSNVTALNDWNTTINESPCNGNVSNWKGVRCNNDGTVFGLKLEQLGLGGVIDVNALMELKNLRTLSFMNNNLEGPIPDVNKLGSLRVLYLSYNRFSGEISGDGFAGMNSLKILHLAGNQFSGKIPKSVIELSKLTELNLEGNEFSRKIPIFRQKGIAIVNVANNRLEGSIPGILSEMSPSYFLGNKHLCGKPLLPCKSSNKRIIIIISIASSIILAFIAIPTLLHFRKRKSIKSTLKNPQQQDTKSQKNFHYNIRHPEEKRGGENGKLVFVKDVDDTFDLQDLLRASAEVLGNGNLGSSYKAVLLNGNPVVVKRFREMNKVGKREFDEHMTRLGRLSHPNLLPLMAFYYRKEEKLLVYDFVPNGSLANLLHAKRAPGQPGLDWPKRLNIIKGVVRALAYLYQEFPALTLPHGHLKSSNVLLNPKFEPILTDYTLVPLMNKEQAQGLMVAYRSPEFTQHEQKTRKTDVWSVGILILEMLTGKYPANYLREGKTGNADLASWVNSVVREEWTGEVFDKDMKGSKRGEGEMLKLLKIGLCCCEWNLEKRWDLRQVVQKIEELKERGSDLDEYSSYASDGDVYSSVAFTDDDFSFSHSMLQ